jgi:hypothetical protein
MVLVPLDDEDADAEQRDQRKDDAQMMAKEPMISERGVTVGEPLREFRGIMTGVPQYEVPPYDVTQYDVPQHDARDSAQEECDR